MQSVAAVYDRRAAEPPFVPSIGMVDTACPPNPILRFFFPMIHRPARDKLAQALRQYVSGQISNDELDDVTVDGPDEGAFAVKGMAWRLYSDNSVHYADGRHYLEKPARDIIGRWILFLHSDLEYLWPEYNFMQIVNWPLNILTFGWWNRRKEKKFGEFETAGDFSVWPFFSKRDYEALLRSPRYMTGRQS